MVGVLHEGPDGVVSVCVLFLLIKPGVSGQSDALVADEHCSRNTGNITPCACDVACCL